MVSRDDIDSLITEWFSQTAEDGSKYEIALLYGKIEEKLHEQLRYYMKDK